MTPKDFVRDQNPATINRAKDLMEFPEYAAESGIKSASELDGLDAVAFADPVNRILPCHTKAATFWSAAYFGLDPVWNEMASPQIRELVKNRLEKAAAMHGIALEVEACMDLAEAYAEIEKAAAEEEKEQIFALLVNEKSGDTIGYYPITSEFQTVKSASELDVDFTLGKLPVDWYYSACREIVKRAKYLMTNRSDICDSVWEAGDVRLPNFDNAMDVAKMRKEAGVPDAGVKLYTEAVTNAEKAYGELRKQGSSDEEKLERVDQYVALWSDLDKHFKVKYARLVPNPGAAFYSGETIDELQKAAAELVMVGDTVIPRLVLCSLKPEQVEAAFVVKTASIVKAACEEAKNDGGKATETLASLTSTQTRTLLKLLAGS